MTLDRIAVLSDVHGNLTALEAVLADIAARGVTHVVNLGDYVGKGPRGSAVVDRCRAACAVNVRGNWDDFLPVTPPTPRPRCAGGTASCEPTSSRGSLPCP
ncbi:metallophosphoesterase family protein [Oerskovia jenensis]|uniref:Phosphodiesterase n=1 Tax=Oerskovia jenensis TaxID=162169 RepID=A0ABS2LKZ3_9CELL|nr:metallophosphoesterase family protein [Oerskovia jenensis]MBM7480887.1 putative phosphodiesterase [Oerskovia jenensis]